MSQTTISTSTRGRSASRGGVRPIVPARRCRYCGRALTRYCQAKRVWNIGPVRIEGYILICRTGDCRQRAAMDGWL